MEYKYNYDITEEYMEPVQFVLKRDDIPYSCKQTEDGYQVLTDLSEEDFEIVLEDAECEIQRNSTFSRAPVYSLRTLCNKEKFQRLMALNQRKKFQYTEKG